MFFRGNRIFFLIWWLWFMHHQKEPFLFSIKPISESIFHSYQTYRAFCVHKLNKLATLKYSISIWVYYTYRWYLDLNNLLSIARCAGYLITNVYVVEQIICIQTKILCHVNHANQIYSGWADKLVSKQTYQMISPSQCHNSQAI